MHLGSFHCLLPVGLCFPIPAQRDGSLPHFHPEAKHKCCSCPSAMLAKVPWLLNNSMLFPGGLSEPQVEAFLQGSALFSVTSGAVVAYADALLPPGPTGPTSRPIHHSASGLCSALGGRKSIPDSLLGDIPNPAPSSPNSCYIPWPWKSFCNNLPTTKSWNVWPSSPSL